MKLYDELAAWWPLISAPEDYEEEAGIYADAFALHGRREIRTMLELGSGGGNNASWLKQRFELTLCDVSPGMLEVSRTLNPDLEHHVGDMRTVRLGRTFDAVLIHDAIVYMTTEADLAAAIGTAAAHLEPDGMALFVPDDTAETYRPETEHGGHDGDGRSARYFTWGEEPDGTTCWTTYVYVLRDGSTEIVEWERHTWGLFGRDTWLRLIADAGLEPVALPYPHSDFDYERELFGGHKPA